MSNRQGTPGPASAILTFLIADVRGYTAYTRSAGDEAAARLAAAFAEIVREGVEAFGGEVIELRGDEALAVFGSARGGLRSAAALQAVFGDETTIRPEIPLAVGIGLDAGEAVRVEQGYRGAALNVAARLCSVARAGEIIASESVVHLAGATAGLVVEPRGGLELKGLGQPVDAFQVTAPTQGRPAMSRPGSGAEIPPGLDAFGPVVGREREVRALRWAWRSARTRPVIRVIRGPAGVGKTRLAAEIAVLAAEDGAPARYESAVADPDLIARAVDETITLDGPTLLVLDDLDDLNAAAGTAAAIDSIVGARSRPPGLVLLIATDSTDPPPAVARALGRAAGDADPIALGPLDEVAVAEILAVYGTGQPDPRHVHTITQASQGLPGQVLVLAAEGAQEE
ncbi:MAG: adenylate/guanylate cyclase domain-containing protein, partial [Candidatus Limnocylindrales bacterium]